MLRPNQNNHGGNNNNQHRPPQQSVLPIQQNPKDSFQNQPNQERKVEKPAGFGGGNNYQNNNKPKQEEKKVLETKSSVEIYWDNFVHFIKEAFMKTPYETLFEFSLLIAGGTRTIQLFNTMGQSGFAAVVGLIYSEIGIILYEFLIYKGKRVKVKKKDKRTGNEYEVYPFVNQKSLAKWGLWLVHIPLTVFFTTSDLILENLEAISGSGDMTSNFAWILGFVIGAAFLADLVILINYKEKNPARIHDERMFELLNEKEEFELKKEEIRLRAQIEYEKKNAKPLIELEAKFGKREEIMTKYSPKFGEEYVNNALEDVGLNFGKPNRPDAQPPHQVRPQPQLENREHKPLSFSKNEEETDEELIENLENRIKATSTSNKSNGGGDENFQQPRRQE